VRSLALVGNPVCAAAGLAVMEIIEEEGLQAHALTVGNHLKQRLSELQQDYPVIGAVRGAGLFIGIEFVADACVSPLPPAPAATHPSRHKQRH
jgi:4-aminobutyrate aminotransferase-like enzyme